MSDLDTRVINCLIVLKEHEIYKFLCKNIPKEFFITRDREYSFIRTFSAKYGKMPSKSLMRRKFPTMSFFRVKDPFDSLAEELSSRYSANRIADFVNGIDPDSVLDELPKLKTEAQKLSVELMGADQEATDHEYTNSFRDRFSSYMDRKQNISSTTFTCGVKQMDDLLNGGLTPPQLVVVAGDPKLGKTWFTVNLIVRNYRRGKNILYISPEMGYLDIAYRTDAMRFKLPYSELKSGKLGIAKERRWKRLAAKDKNPLYIVDTTEDHLFTPSKIVAKIGMYKPDMVVIDSAYYLRADGVSLTREETYLDRQRLIQQLKSVCKEHNVPIVCVVQMKPDTEKSAVNNESALRGIYGGDHWSQGCDVLLRITGNRADNYRKLVLLANREGATFKEVLVRYQFEPYPKIYGIDNVPTEALEADELEEIAI